MATYNSLAHKLRCVTGCSHCGTLCKTQVISFPTLEDIKRLRRAEKRVSR
jgi:hypothetical protein